MNEAFNGALPAGVLIEREQPNSAAREDVERLISAVSAGDVRGRVLESRDESEEMDDAHLMRRWAIWGAFAGFVVGLVPLLTSIMLAAGLGALLAKASELRFDRGSAPRLRWRSRRRSERA